MNECIEKVLLSEKELHDRVSELGARITADYRGRKLLLVSVLKGSVIFMADLMRAIDLPCEIDFMAVSTYGAGVKTSGVVEIKKDLDRQIDGYDVLIVEDILDSGVTLSYLMKVLTAKNPNSIRICTLLDKPARRKAKDVSATYAGFEVPDEFVVGYGLDYAEKFRNLPYIGILQREVYEK
ncbi:MAG: hypoxanthine phosphoribosyltransferase [Clostridia bacterium]|nr:hypoxanthine phosphoribosyltransferase [Clostridia bacterium]